MSEMNPDIADLPEFDRKFWDGKFRCTRIGTGALGGKAHGLVSMMALLDREIDSQLFPDVLVNIPTMAVVATNCFDEFIAQNHLGALPCDELSDSRIATIFQQAELPAELLGDLRALILQVKTPLAVRSSGLLEDALEHPFAGVYATKMIPNNQLDPDTRFRHLVEAIKFVYASTYFKDAQSYIRTTGRAPSEEKMAVILQEVVGRRHGDRFYPDVAGVARSFNFYPALPARPEDGLISLALGLGKTIVDGEAAWTYSPAYPKNPRPYGSIRELLRESQTAFWAVNMGKAPAYDPVNELEYLVRLSIDDAEEDEVLSSVASTYDAENDRIVPGAFARGPRIINFSPILVGERFSINNAVRSLLRVAEKAAHANVEIEFALTFEKRDGLQDRAHLGFLQVRPMLVPNEICTIEVDSLRDPRAIVSSDMVMGNGQDDSIQDIVYVRPEQFSSLKTPAIAAQIDVINRELTKKRRPYLLIGFGRWGSSHSSLGIPVTWGQISGARAIVEATLPQMNVELSQGSHFFHNLSSFRASYFMVPCGAQFKIDWDWLNRQPAVQQTEFVRHVRPAQPLSVRVNGRNARGVILRSGDAVDCGARL